MEDLGTTMSHLLRVHFGWWWWLQFKDHRVGPMSHRWAVQWAKGAPEPCEIRWERGIPHELRRIG